MNVAVDRRFLVIFCLSLALHGSLLMLTCWPCREVTVKLPPLIASIRLLDVAEPGARVAAPALPAPAALPQKVRQSSPRVEHLSAPRMAPAAGPATKPAAPSAPALPGARPSEQMATPVASPAQLAPSAPAPVAEPKIVAVPAQSELLAAYRQRLGELFARHQEYPRVAAMRGWEGEVRLRLRVARKGNLLAVQLDHSSGFDVLDRHAVAMLEALAALPPLPEALDSHEIQVVVPINYKLKNTT